MKIREPLVRGVDYERIRIPGKRWKYRTLRDITVYIPIETHEVDTPYFSLSYGGLLVIFEGYAWDGATCAWDTPTIMRGSLCHDAVYQALRERLLMPNGLYCPVLHRKIRKMSDDIFIEICKVDGMCAFRRWYVARGLQIADGRAAAPILT
jgi:hypothetical protein